VDDLGTPAHATGIDKGQKFDCWPTPLPNTGTKTGTPWMTVHTNAERYYPPYLYARPRPTIGPIAGGGDGAELKYGTDVALKVRGISLDSKARAALIRLGSATHGNDMDQRYVWLATESAKSRTAVEWTLTATIPANPATALPGDYQLVVDSHGVSSPGRLVRLVLKATSRP
jgi:hypothetical protein